MDTLASAFTGEAAGWLKDLRSLRMAQGSCRMPGWR